MLGRVGPPPVPIRDHVDADEYVASPASPRSRRSEDHPFSPTGAPPVPGGRSRPEPIRKPSEDPTVSSPVTSPVTRAPPPPPPAGPPSRRTTTDLSSPGNLDDDSDEEVTEYDGDYDTDIASSAKHKDALKSHNRDSSFDDGILTDDAAKSPKSPQSRNVPPLPPMPAQHSAPPPPPQGPPSRKSTDAPRAPPPVPPPAMPEEGDEDEYDPYRYNSPSHGLPTPQLNDVYKTMSPGEEREEEDMYGASVQPPRMPPPPPADRSAPPPPPSDRAAPPPPPGSHPPAPMSPPAEPSAAPPKPSTDIRRSMTTSRRSMEQPRPSGDGFMARDVDLGHSSFWWTQPNLPPPSLMNRSDLIFEMEENSSTKRGGRVSVAKDIYILYTDYSRTIVNAVFDQSEPSQVTFEQHHERPPPPARKDELERASETFGASIASAASSFGNQGAMVGDGSAQGFVNELFRPLPNALRPIGMRAYGALVYANLANASTQQFDEIRPGDIVSFRNAKFSGHHGALKQKYTLEAGKPDHVAVVVEWDGTKKKVRAWEQRSEDDRKEKKKAKVRDESYRMSDLKSGEVHIWRVVGREYVGWDKA
jgi:myosin tail region-interacting protein MTI1